MGKALVIVESPAKARTISGMLGPDFIVESSVGHIRDLPRGADEVPAAYKGESWARLGVDVDNGFKPLYVVSAPKKSVVANLKKLLKGADELYLATDEDREGESIAWHLSEVLSPTVPVKRMVFHEITPAAIARAVDEWRDLDRRLVDAQEARRILDRLYGYEVSPVLWRKVMPRLSAGRVQSVATRMVVERERARMRFRSATWWGVEGTFTNAPRRRASAPRSSALGGATVATGKDFDEHGERTGKSERPRARRGRGDVGRRRPWPAGPSPCSSVTERPFRRSPAAPFMTSTLQQEAGRKLRFSAQRAMQVAQRLYEQGFITYMRTDSTTLSDQALTAARTQAREMYGDAYVPDAPRRYERKVKNAQEAHEAIRPSGETLPHARAGRPRAVGGRAPPVRADLEAHGGLPDERRHRDERAGPPDGRRCPRAWPQGQEAEFSASGRVIAFPGFLRAYVEGEDDPEAELADREVVLPALAVGDVVEGSAFEPGSHATQPPARYTEASLVKAMEELGVGRPSTYASVIATILDRGYVWKKGTALVPSFTAFAVVGPARALLRRPGRLRLHRVDGGRPRRDRRRARGGAALADALLLRQRGAGCGQRARRTRSRRLGLKATVAAHLSEIDAREINSIPLGNGTRRRADRGPGRPLRALPAAGGGPGVHPRRHGARRADHRAGRGDPGRALQRPGARHRPRERARRAGQGGPLRALRPGGRGDRGRGEAAHRLAVLVHGPGDADARAGARAAAHPAHGRDGPRDGRGRRGAQRAVRAVSQARVRHAQPRRARSSCSP